MAVLPGNPHWQRTRWLLPPPCHIQYQGEQQAQVQHKSQRSLFVLAERFLAGVTHPY